MDQEDKEDLYVKQSYIKYKNKNTTNSIIFHDSLS
jgi:hypothetical protein